MSIKETVKQALTQVPGNKPFKVLTVIYHTDPIARQNSGETLLTSDQVTRALRDIPYVRKLGNGRYIVKGRRVPLKVDITTS